MEEAASTAWAQCPPCRPHLTPQPPRLHHQQQHPPEFPQQEPEARRGKCTSASSRRGTLSPGTSTFPPWAPFQTGAMTRWDRCRRAGIPRDTIILLISSSKIWMGRTRSIHVCILGTRVWVKSPALVISRRVINRPYARTALYMRGRRTLGFIASGMEVIVMPEGMYGSISLMGLKCRCWLFG